MHWTEPASAEDSHAELEKTLWGAANKLWADVLNLGCLLEPYHGRFYDPACGSGGMFVQSARFVENHHRNPTAEISVHGQDQWAWGAHGRRAQRARRVRQRRKLPNQRVTETCRLARLNLAVHGLSGDIRQGNTYYENLHNSVGRFDFVLANPPFNVSKIDKERLAEDPQYAFGLPRSDKGNYLWIQHFHAALNAGVPAGFVTADSAAEARTSEQGIREESVSATRADVVEVPQLNLIYAVVLPFTVTIHRGTEGGERRP